MEVRHFLLSLTLTLRVTRPRDHGRRLGPVLRSFPGLALLLRAQEVAELLLGPETGMIEMLRSGRSLPT
jgi:hypothetical protein